MIEAPSYTISFYYRKILVPVDGSESGYKALLLAVDIASRYGSRVTVAYAKPRGISEPEDPIIKAKERLKSISINVSYKYMEYDPLNESPQMVLLREIIEGGYDLVIIGARGKSILGDVNIGSVTLSLVVNAPTSIFIVR
ncbi:MAG: universal stress protein [Desulfurococcaceae archaeon]